MFLHDLKEKKSSMIDIEDMSLEACSTLLGFIYGTVRQDQFWKYRLSLLAAANKYIIPTSETAVRKAFWRISMQEMFLSGFTLRGCIS
uniref:BTB domain-containing protein n=1 Tax=Arundo donax TaxID=35708 RepID=A0A0A9BNR9_ARUDO